MRLRQLTLILLTAARLIELTPVRIIDFAISVERVLSQKFVYKIGQAGHLDNLRVRARWVSRHLADLIKKSSSDAAANDFPRQ
jgi:hypothetical protein